MDSEDKIPRSGFAGEVSQKSNEVLPLPAYPDEHATDHGLNVVDFAKDDPNDPQNWSSRYKWFITMLLAFMSIIV